jgi:hypothetical protein
MRLRERLLRLFILCAVVPLVAIALLGYVRSLRTLDALVESRTRVQVERMAQVFRDRLDHLESDVNLVSANVETQKYLAAVAAGDLARVDGLRAAHDAYLRDVWALMQFAYERLTIRDTGGRTVTLLGEPASPGLPEASPQIRPILRTIRSADGAPLGELELRPRAPELVRGVGLDDRFGDRGWNLLFDRSAGRVIVSGAAGELAGDLHRSPPRSRPWRRDPAAFATISPVSAGSPRTSASSRRRGRCSRRPRSTSSPGRCCASAPSI